MSPGDERQDHDGAAPDARTGLDVLSLSVHGLVRARDIELGRDPDTGGQVSYVVDQAAALARHDRVKGVQVVTRLVEDRRIDEAYARPEEPISGGASIVRLPFGPRRYLRKESLWPYLDSLVDQLARHLRATGRIPDVVHGHYADAGYVGAQLSKILGVPFIFTGHSLGRVKRERLLADGQDPQVLEQRFHLTRRIEAEEQALETAAAVIASTHQEVDDQYERYDHYRPDRMHVIPPGVDLSRFSPPGPDPATPPIVTELGRFLQDVGRPTVLAIARPDDRKNFSGLIRAFSETAGLRERANLVLVAGNRGDLREAPSGSRRVIRGMLELVDRYDLYGSVAYPKEHAPSDVPDLYRWAAHTGGVFVNPALTEPFGLTLLEAAASGLPVVATDDGGPADILSACRNGVLVDPLDHEAMGHAILDAISDEDRWRRWAESGREQVHRTFSWEAHVERYVPTVGPLVRPGRRGHPRVRTRRLARIDRMLVADLGHALLGDDDALTQLGGELAEASDSVAFAIATGRTFEEAQAVFTDSRVPTPDMLVSASGTEIHYGRPDLTPDRSWEHQIAYRWQPDRVRDVLADVAGIRLASPEHQTARRIRLELYGSDPPGPAAVRRRLRQAGVHATVLRTDPGILDVLPIRAAPGLAVRFLCHKWNLEPERVLVAGGSPGTLDVLSGDSLGVVVGNHHPALDELRGGPRILFARGHHARGVLEGMEHYEFLGNVRVPEPDPPAEDDAASAEGDVSEYD